MSDFPSETPLPPWGAPSAGFRADLRFTDMPDEPEPAPEAELPPEPVAEPEDPLALAFAEGLAAGRAEALAEAEDLRREDLAAREGLALAFTRLDRDLTEQLRLRLRDTVAALCEGALAPLALDEDALFARIERAAAMLARADDERVIRMHPQDLAFMSPRLAADWTVLPDPALERGAVRIETASGGVEDGPAQWRQAIREALHLC